MSCSTTLRWNPVTTDQLADSAKAEVEKAEVCAMIDSLGDIGAATRMRRTMVPVSRGLDLGSQLVVAVSVLAFAVKVGRAHTGPALAACVTGA
jgi:hypothetical protein